MEVSNLRYEIDQNTFEPHAIVDVKVGRMTLYEINLVRDEVRNEIFEALGRELVEQMLALQKDQQ